MNERKQQQKSPQPVHTNKVALNKYLLNSKTYQLRVAAHRLRNFLLMVAMHDYYYCILTGASPLLHKDKVPAEGAAH